MNILNQTYTKFGLIMSALVVVCLAYMEISGNNQTFAQSPMSPLVMTIITIIIWWYALKQKKEMQKGKLTFKEGLSESFKISLVFALTSPLVFLAYYTFVNPEIVDSVREAFLMTNASRAQVIAMDMSAQVVSALIFGTIIGAIISFFMKSKK